MQTTNSVKLQLLNGYLPATFFVASILIFPGCDPVAKSPAPGTNAGSTSTSQPAADAEVVRPSPMLKGWENPQAVLVFSGEQHGYVEPCGCSETQSGGLARRHDLFKQLAERNWPSAGLDIGGTLKRSRKQSELKFAFTQDALHDMNYQALGLGPEELRMGPDFLFTAYSEAQANEKLVPFMAANVIFYGSRDLGTPATHRVFQVGDIKVGVTAIVGQKHIPAFANDPSSLVVEDPIATLAAVTPILEAEAPDLMVLLSHAPPEESRSFAEQFPQYNIVVTAEGPEDPLPDAEKVGETRLLRVSQKGKSAGVIGIFAAEGSPKPELRYELVNLDRFRFETSPQMVDHMRTYQAAIAALDLASTEPAIAHPSGDEFVGAEACAKCHRKAYGIWSKSRHGHAFESLAHGRPGMEATWVNRQKDPECLACHVTGWAPADVLRFEGGFTTAEATPHLAAQGCENCHGPGGSHSDLEWAFQKGAEMTPAQTAARKAMHLDKAWAKDNLCVKCHDLDNSPKFDFETYWPKVQHSGRD